jgi:hypothetical protein
LSYYYGGLGFEDFIDTFHHLLRLDQANIEYALWLQTGDPGLEDSFRHLNSVNVRDRSYCMDSVFASLRCSKNTIDYFLTHLVFPKEMRKFSHKLSGSGWDLGREKAHPTTGFSGTSDSRHLLPLNVERLDVPPQEHTNALVLGHLLQDENSVEIIAPRLKSRTSDAKTILDMVNCITPPARVILDVGAQILDLNNDEVAKLWLSMVDEETTKAAVYFNGKEELCVIDRKGRVELLHDSPFSDNLGDCVIYLDEAHTRGTDLKFPRDYRAAVTLGANLTKDKLVQGTYSYIFISDLSSDLTTACMRMRQLGKGQAVVFCVPEEIRAQINCSKSQPKDADIGVIHVLTWAISETWKDLRRTIPIWANQGCRFQRIRHKLDGTDLTPQEAKEFLEAEGHSIEQLYHPRPQTQLHEAQHEDRDTSDDMLKNIMLKCEEFDVVTLDSATLQGEQERELSHEIEEERQTELPLRMDPAPHSISQGLQEMIRSGAIPKNTQTLIPAFSALARCSIAGQLDLDQFSTDLFVTADFNRTVRVLYKATSKDHKADAYQRPVQWVLSVSNECRHILVVISPFEANELLPDIRQSSKVTLHLYAPRTNLAYGPLDALDLYTVGKEFDSLDFPRSPIIQLNLYAGQLYLRSYDEYVELCNHLGLSCTTANEDEKIANDGFIRSSVGAWGLQESPVSFLKELLTKIRMGCQIDRTHLGRILNGELLQEGDFEYRRTVQLQQKSGSAFLMLAACSSAKSESVIIMYGNGSTWLWK